MFLFDVDLSFNVSCLAFYIGVGPYRDFRQNYEIIIHILRNENKLIRNDYLYQRNTVSTRSVSLASQFLTIFCSERLCPDMWCASEKMCISEDWICYGWGGCSDDGFDGEPDNCGKFMRENCPIFPFLKLYFYSTSFQANVCTIFENKWSNNSRLEVCVPSCLLKGTKVWLITAVFSMLFPFVTSMLYIAALKMIPNQSEAMILWFECSTDL